MRLSKRMLLLPGLVLVGMQFVPADTNSKTGAVSAAHIARMVDPQVDAILDRSCLDCHSANTRWPWYSRVAPMSWLLARDVRRGRAKLDFSQWAGRSHSGNERMEICDAVSDGSMPLKPYTLVHRDARLSKQDVDVICDWATSWGAAAPDPQAGAASVTAASLTHTNNGQQGAK